MSKPTPIAPSGFSFENSIAVEPADSGYGAARSFTLADSFYDAHANDVLLPRKEHPISVEPVDSSEPSARYTYDPEVALDELDSDADAHAAMPSLWPDQAQDKNRPPAYFVAPPVAMQTEAALPETVLIEEKRVRRLMSPEARMEDSFRIPVIATFVFVITMIAIFYLGSHVAGYYAPVVQGDRVEFVGRPK